MRLFDSNLVIYSASAQYEQLRPLLLEAESLVSAITKVETLGYHKLAQQDRTYFEALFNLVPVLPVSAAIIDLAVDLRQQKRMSLGDCLIAATALLNRAELYTNNTADFQHIPELIVVNPLEVTR